jgi:hypothetical protein
MITGQIEHGLEVVSDELMLISLMYEKKKDFG